MKVHFLGTGAGNFRGSRRQPCSALLDRLLLDCGAGATGRLHDLHRFESVDAVLISHLHSDHVAGLFDFLLHTLITKRTRPLTVVAPPGLGRLLQAAFAVKGTVVDPSTLYDFRVIESDRIETAIGPWSVRSFSLDHTVVNLGYLLSTDGLSVFYSGDTREPAGPSDLRADYLIHEATYADRFSSLARDYGHSTASDAARAALRLGARRLLINHIGDGADADAEIARDARRVCSESQVVEDRSEFEL